MYIDLMTAKKHLNIDKEFIDDDEYIIQLIQASEDAVAKRLNVRNLSCLENRNTGGLPDSVIHSILLLIGNYYQNREPIAMGNSMKIPYTLDFLFDLNKNYKNPF